MSENTGSKADSLNQMMTHGVIAILLTLGGFALYYNVMNESNTKPSAPAAASSQTPPCNPWLPFKQITKEDIEQIQKELDEQQQFQDEGNKKFGTVPGKLSKQ